MKKIFFAALLATVSIGGAFAQYTTIPGGIYSTLDCKGNDNPTCEGLNMPIYPVGSTTPVGQEVLDQMMIFP